MFIKASDKVREVSFIFLEAKNYNNYSELAEKMIVH